MLDRINAQTGGMAEVVLGGDHSFVMFLLAPELVSPTSPSTSTPADNTNTDDNAAAGERRCLSRVGIPCCDTLWTFWTATNDLSRGRGLG